MTVKRDLTRPWFLRRLRRWVIKPQKELERLKRRWLSLPPFLLPQFLRECRQLLALLLRLRPDIVLGNARSGLPYVQVLERRLRQAGIEVRYERLCSAWGHKLRLALKPAASVHWLHEALAKRKRIIMVDVSRKPFSDAQRIVGGVILWLYNETVSQLVGEPQPPELVQALNKQMRDYLRQQIGFAEALDEIRSVLNALGIGSSDISSLPFARHLLVRRFEDFAWDAERGCLMPVNASRRAWIDDRTDKYAWLPLIARWLL